MEGLRREGASKSLAGLALDGLHSTLPARLAGHLGISTGVLASPFHLKCQRPTPSLSQAFLLTTDTQGKVLLSPLIANCLFVVLGSALMLGAIAAASVNVMAGNHLWTAFAALIARMKEYESSWTEGTNILSQLLTLKPTFDHVTELSEHSRM